jgi:hypothetical protein
VQIDYDITEISGSPAPQHFSGLVAAPYGTLLSEYRFSTTGHVKITYIDNTVRLYLDDVLQTIYTNSQTSQNLTTEPVYFRYWGGGVRSYKVKNLRIKQL